jgi:hypothetical protein
MLLYEKLDKDTQNKSRVFNYYYCDSCGTEYKKQKRIATGSVQEHYCSKTCYNKEKIRIKVNCAHCGVEFTKAPSKIKISKSGLHFCCREHKDLAQSYMKEIQPTHYGTSLTRYREKALNNLPNSCASCGYDNIHALEVHHIDRDRTNNDISNLQILCANCHTLEHKGKL